MSPEEFDKFVSDMAEDSENGRNLLSFMEQRLVHWNSMRDERLDKNTKQIAEAVELAKARKKGM